MKNFLEHAKSTLQSNLKSGAFEVVACALQNQALPRKIEEKIEDALPGGLRLAGTRVVNLNREEDILTAQIEIKLDTKDASLAYLMGDL